MQNRLQEAALSRLSVLPSIFAVFAAACMSHAQFFFISIAVAIVLSSLFRKWGFFLGVLVLMVAWFLPSSLSDWQKAICLAISFFSCYMEMGNLILSDEYRNYLDEQSLYKQKCLETAHLKISHLEKVHLDQGNERKNEKNQELEKQKQLENSIKELEIRCVKEHEEKEAFAGRCSKLQIALDDLEKRNEDLKSQLEKQIHSLEEQKRTSSLYINELNIRLAQTRDVMQENGKKHAVLEDRLKETEGLYQEEKGKILQLQAELSLLMEERDKGSNEASWQVAYQELRKQFEEKSDVLDRTRKDLFFTDHRMQALEKENEMRLQDECYEQNALVLSVLKAEEECAKLEEELKTMEEIISSLSVEKKKVTRPRKTKKEKDERQFDLTDMLAGKLKKNSLASS